MSARSRRVSLPPRDRGSIRSEWRRLVLRFIAQDDGQDLVEYAFLAAFIGIAGWAVLMTIDDVVRDVYLAWLDPDAGVPSLWDPEESVTGS